MMACGNRVARTKKNDNDNSMERQSGNGALRLKKLQKNSWFFIFTQNQQTSIKLK